MFTGIVQGIARIVAIKDSHDFRQYIVELPEDLTSGIELGASIANNGCCLTVTKVKGRCVNFDLMIETLRKTNLGELKIGDYVNVERAAKFGDEIGGHLMSGHIACMGQIAAFELHENQAQMTISLPPDMMKYVLYKGFIGVDGISLTVGEVTETTFKLYLIPETLSRTTLGNKKVGDKVNIELDTQTQTIVDTVERLMSQR